jgi:hypothetical protein
MIIVKVQPAMVESARSVAEKIVQFAGKQNLTPWFGGSVEDNQAGLIGQYVFSHLLTANKVDHLLPAYIGRTTPFDLSIRGIVKPVLCEIKTGVFDGDLENVLGIRGYGFLVGRKQFDAGRGKNIDYYISMQICKDFSRCAYMGRIRTKEIEDALQYSPSTEAAIMLDFNDLRDDLENW